MESPLRLLREISRAPMTMGFFVGLQLRSGLRPRCGLRRRERQLGKLFLHARDPFTRARDLVANVRELFVRARFMLRLLGPG